MRFKIRTLLIVTAVAAFFTLPVYRKSVELYHQWTKPESTMTVVTVPDGGTIIMGSRTFEILRDGRRRVDGKIVPAPRKLGAFEEQALSIWESVQW